MTRRVRACLVGAAVLVAGVVAAVPAVAGGQRSAGRTGELSMKVYRQQVPPLGSVGGVTVTGDGFGSAVAPVPGHPQQVYGLTDRGPNVDGPHGTKIEPYPDFTPAIGRFRLRHGRAELLRTIPLRAADGTPYNGRVNSGAGTGETITDLAGTTLAASPYGYDSEGLVARPDGTFWVSDEYGPFVSPTSTTGAGPSGGCRPTTARCRPSCGCGRPTGAWRA